MSAKLLSKKASGTKSISARWPNRTKKILTAQKAGGGRGAKSHPASPASAVELAGELRELRMQIAELRRRPELGAAALKHLTAAEALIQEAADEARKPFPVGARIQETLARAAKFMEGRGSGISVPPEVGPKLAGLEKAARRIFHSESRERRGR